MIPTLFGTEYTVFFLIDGTGAYTRIPRILPLYYGLTACMHASVKLKPGSPVGIFVWSESIPTKYHPPCVFAKDATEWEIFVGIVNPLLYSIKRPSFISRSSNVFMSSKVRSSIPFSKGLYNEEIHPFSITSFRKPPV